MRRQLRFIERAWWPCIVLASAHSYADAPEQGQAPGNAASVKAVTATAPTVLIGITAPAKSASVASIHPARIARIFVKEGAFAKEGALLVQLSDDVQRARVAVSSADADMRSEIDLTQARWRQARSESTRLERLHGGASASSKELEDARLQQELRRLELEIARHKQDKAQRSLAREHAVLEEYRIRAPFSGYVSHQMKFVGESVDQLEPILTIVQLDPLHVTVDCPLELAESLRPGNVIRVVPVTPIWEPRIGKAVLVHKVADGASQTFRVRIAVDNHDGQWMAGLKVRVEFSATAVAAISHKSWERKPVGARLHE